MYWWDYSGEKVHYKTLSPGQRHRQQTYLTHPWTFKTLADDDEDEDEDVRCVVHSSSVFHPPPDTVDSDEDEDFSPAESAATSSSSWMNDEEGKNRAFRTTKPKVDENWTIRNHFERSHACYESNAFRLAVQDTIMCWKFSCVKQKEVAEENGEIESTSTTTFNDLPFDVVLEIMR